MITRFGVRNYKALRDVAIDLTPVHLLIGPNDSGKTSVLEALRILSRVPVTECEQLATVFPGPWEGAELVWQRRFEEPLTLRADLAGGQR